MKTRSIFFFSSSFSFERRKNANLAQLQSLFSCFLNSKFQNRLSFRTNWLLPRWEEKKNVGKEKRRKKRITRSFARDIKPRHGRKRGGILQAVHRSHFGRAKIISSLSLSKSLYITFAILYLQHFWLTRGHVDCKIEKKSLECSPSCY